MPIARHVPSRSRPYPRAPAVAVLALSALLSAAAPAGAQGAEPDAAPRVGLRIGYGGRGADWDVSIESPHWLDFVRLRAGVGHGRWVDQFASPPAGADPVVTRLAASVLLTLQERRSHYSGTRFRQYVGIGIGLFVPHRPELSRQLGVRLTCGMEGSGDRWTIGPEVELDVPNRGPVPQSSNGSRLLLAGRIGIAVRRRF